MQNFDQNRLYLALGYRLNPAFDVERLSKPVKEGTTVFPVIMLGSQGYVRL